MTILPIVEVTLRQASRRRWTYWSRVVAVILASLVAIPASLAVGRMRGGALAGFAGMSPVILIMFLSASLRSTADSISSEKREGTLGLLFLTDLKGRDIVLGKLVGACASRFSSWLAALPPATILVLAGGVTWADVLRIMLAAANIQFCGAAAGLLGSAICREQKKALSIGSTWLLITCLLFPVAAIAVSEFWKLNELAAALMAVSPGAAFFNALGGLGALSTKTAWIQLLVSHLVGWSALAMACWFTPRLWQDRPVKTPRSAAAPVASAASERVSPECISPGRATARASTLDRNPFVWLLSRDRWNAFMPWVIVSIGIVLGAVFWTFNSGAYGSIVSCFWVAFIFHITLKAKLGEQATRGLFDEKKSGALEYLLTTRLTPSQLVDGQWESLRNHFKRPILLLLAIDGAFLVGTILNVSWIGLGREPLSEWILLIAGWNYLIITLIVDSYALGWAGMWEALRGSKSWQKTRGNAFALVSVIPIGVFILLWLGLMIVTGGDAANIWLFFIGWFAFGMLGNLFCFGIFRPVVRGRFRKLVRESILKARIR